MTIPCTLCEYKEMYHKVAKERDEYASKNIALKECLNYIRKGIISSNQVPVEDRHLLLIYITLLGLPEQGFEEIMEKYNLSLAECGSARSFNIVIKNFLGDRYSDVWENTSRFAKLGQLYGDTSALNIPTMLSKL